MLLPVVLLSFTLVFSPAMSLAGDYLNSAHGSPKNGVSRRETAKVGFARANCSHCHDFHGGTEISGAGAGSEEAYSYSLYAPNFDPRNRSGIFTETSNICFSCHNTQGSAQQVPGKNFSQSMGCSTLQGPTDTLGEFNQISRHNLYDIWKFLSSDSESYPWFNEQSNPCSACHNPHLARSKSKNPHALNITTLSKPSDHFSLWSQSMESTYSTKYESPLCSGTGNREPAATQRNDVARNTMIDYVSFCTDCHNDNTTLYSSVLERNLVQIDWSNNGDIHGSRNASTSFVVKPPYLTNSPKNYVLSCLDCHEPHGSSNTALLRNWVNGGKLLGTISTSIALPPGTGNDTQNVDMGFLCMRCHEQDVDTGTNADNPPQWQILHHGTTESPYTATTDCESCHELEAGTGSAPLPIECVNCHFHGSTDSWLKELATDRVTF